jgi:structural maintenance of chromosome 3 (chondroitin sulfate proteoglycan 6)
VEKYLAKKDVLTKQKEDSSKKIRDLGVLPEEAFNEKYGKMGLDKVIFIFCWSYQSRLLSFSHQLMKNLHKVKDSLKEFSNVNKKAFEQYSGFTKQRDGLLQRRKDLDQSAESIQELIEVLDQRKDEAISRTFRQVSRYFEEVFSTLVPAGRGRLLMLKKLDMKGGPEEELDGSEEENDEEDEEEDVDDEGEDDAMEVDDDERPTKKTKSSKKKGKGSKKDSIENYVGVAIKVSFNSKVDEGLRIQQLSGGQKSLVALAMGKLRFHMTDLAFNS